MPNQTHAASDGRASDAPPAMKVSSHVHCNSPCILVEGPNWGDAEFYGKWLLAAAQAETFWKEAGQDPDFCKQVERVCLGYIPAFGISASEMVMRLEEYRTTLVLDLYSEEGGDLVMMVAMGFFAPTNQRRKRGTPNKKTAFTKTAFATAASNQT